MNTTTNVLMYVRSNGTQEPALQACRLLQQIPGIRHVRTARATASAILVDYDHARITARQMLASLHGQGIPARLIGM